MIVSDHLFGTWKGFIFICVVFCFNFILTKYISQNHHLKLSCSLFISWHWSKAKLLVCTTWCVCVCVGSVYNGTKKGTHSFCQRCSPWSLYQRCTGAGGQEIVFNLFCSSGTVGDTTCAGEHPGHSDITMGLPKSERQRSPNFSFVFFFLGSSSDVPGPRKCWRWIRLCSNSAYLAPQCPTCLRKRVHGSLFRRGRPQIVGSGGAMWLLQPETKPFPPQTIFHLGCYYHSSFFWPLSGKDSMSPVFIQGRGKIPPVSFKRHFIFLTTLSFYYTHMQRHTQTSHINF